MAVTAAEKYEVLKELGRGSFGIAYMVRRKADGLILCRKEISYKKMPPKERAQLQAEIDSLRHLRHPNIVAYYDHAHLKETCDVHLYMEYCGNGDLEAVIKNLKTSNMYADEEFVWTILTQLVEALYSCHNGEAPPPANKEALGLPTNAAPLRSKKGNAMIIHRDLKPENVFLGENNAVKLGDFGLSKIIAPHDFASTFVGSPLYMSPEVGSGERYSLHSDIWSLGCIIYQLCAKEPPFNSRVLNDLNNKIKAGKFAPLPRHYSKELCDVVYACLRVNPNTRPDTAALINLPRVKLVRSAHEGAVVLQQHITARKDAIAALTEAQEKIAKMETEMQAARERMDAQLRLEWEAKAALEITRQVDIAGEKMREHYSALFEAQVEQEVARRLEAISTSQSSFCTNCSSTASDKTGSTNKASRSTSPALQSIGEADEEPPVELSSLSLEDSPLSQRTRPANKTGRTPLTRARTYAGAQQMMAQSPIDVKMIDPSPMSIASLSLSPRRIAQMHGSRLQQPAFTRDDNSFDRGIQDRKLPLFPASEMADEGSDDDDDSPSSSPTRTKMSGDPFRKANAGGRPGLTRQRTTPVQMPQMQQRLKTGPTFNAPTAASNIKAPSAGLSSSPNGSRPTRITRNSTVTSPNRVAPPPPAQASPTALAARKGKEDMIRAVHRNNLEGHAKSRGRTLVELAQARGGIPTPERQQQSEAGSKVPLRSLDREREKQAPLWNPETDEMPSPFLVRTRKIAVLPR